MKRITKVTTTVLLALALLLTTACESSREIPTRQAPQGEEVKCIGVVGTKRPGIEYELSTRNTVVGVIFFQTVFTPVVVLAKETFCPVADTTIVAPVQADTVSLPINGSVEAAK